MIELRTLGSAGLLGPDGRAMHTVLAQPKRFALLVYLAVATPRGFHRRDALLPLFWPEMDQDRARGALRKALHHLRQSLGAELLPGRGDEEVGVDDEALDCDVHRFERMLEQGGERSATEALELYRGDLLAGFHLSDAPEFEQWLERERTRLRRRAAEAAWLASEESESRDGSAAVAFARRALALGDDGEVAMRRLLALHDRLGDRAGAARDFDDYRRRLAEQYQLEPSHETTALMRAIAEPPVERAGEVRRPPFAIDRETSPVASTAPPPLSPTPVDSDPDPMRAPRTPSAARSPSHLRSWRRIALGLAAIGLLATGAIAVTAVRRGPTPASPVLAVGAFQDFSGQGDRQLARVLPNLLTTSLARASGVRVVSSGRLYGALPPDEPPSAPHLGEAARQAGAAYLIEGAVYRRAEDRLQLDIRRVDLRTGAIESAYSVTGADPYELVERVSEHVLAWLGAAAPAVRLADVTTTSLVAQRFYEEGLRTLYRGDDRAAAAYFDAALEEDSTFAMAAYYASESHLPDLLLQRSLLERAVRLSTRATERERLLIRAQWADVNDDPARLALAETLAVRYPHEPDGHLLLGRFLLWDGDFGGAVAELRRAFELDSASLGEPRARCLACEALGDMRIAYEFMDSLSAAERVARDWTRLQPASASAWRALADAFEAQSRWADAAAAQVMAVRVQGGVTAPLDLATTAIRAGNYAEADRRLDAIARSGDPAVQGGVAWYRTISLRSQGRLEAALAAVRRIRSPALGWGDGVNRMLQAQVLFEMGRPREAAILFDSSRAVKPVPVSARTLDNRGLGARGHIWGLTHVAECLAAAGDTGRLEAIADTMARLGPTSAYGRDRRLPDHVRGLLLAARGDDEAAVRAFRRSIFSPVAGYTRTNVALARALVRLGRPAEAIPVLQAALHGDIEASTLYQSRTEVHEALARAFDAAGMADSAAAHYRATVEAWSRADEILVPRRERARARLERLERAR